MSTGNDARQATAGVREQLQALPRGSLVPVDWVLELLSDGRDGPARLGAPAVDLNVADLALLFKKKPSTVRAWIERGDFPGAYKLQQKEWRVPRSAVDAFQATQARGTDTPQGLGAWRTRPSPTR